MQEMLSTLFAIVKFLVTALSLIEVHSCFLFTGKQCFLSVSATAFQNNGLYGERDDWVTLRAS